MHDILFSRQLARDPPGAARTGSRVRRLGPGRTHDWRGATLCLLFGKNQTQTLRRGGAAAVSQ